MREALSQMNYIVLEMFMGVHQDSIGPFPSQDQAMTYAEIMAENNPRRNYRVRQLLTPAFIPEPIHS